MFVIVVAACGGSSEAERFCDLRIEIGETLERSLVPANTPAELEDGFRTVMALADEALGVVPDEVRSEFVVVVGWLTAEFEVWEEAGFDEALVDDAAERAITDAYAVPLTNSAFILDSWQFETC